MTRLKPIIYKIHSMHFALVLKCILTRNATRGSQEQAGVVVMIHLMAMKHVLVNTTTTTAPSKNWYHRRQPVPRYSSGTAVTDQPHRSFDFALPLLLLL